MNCDNFDRSQEIFLSIAKMIEGLIGEAHIPGVSFGIYCNGEIDTASFGVTSVDNPLPVNDDTLFQIGSITKTFVALASMRLIEQGKLDLDVPVREYLPGLKLMDEEAASSITMRHILTHTSGLKGDYFQNFGYGPEALQKMIESLSEVPQLNTPGTSLAYCNSGFYIAGRVIEAISGVSFEDALASLVFKPLNLDNAFFFPEDVMIKRFAVGHEIKEDKPSVASPWGIGRGIHPAGGIVTNVKDLLKYASFFLGNGFFNEQEVIKESSMEKLTAESMKASPALGMALGWFVEEIDGVKFIEHGGGTHGQISFLIIAPELKFAAAILTNSYSGDAAIGAFTKSVMEGLLGLEIKTLSLSQKSPEELEEFVGLYEGELANLELFVEEGKLFLKQIPLGGFPAPDSPAAPPSPPIEVAISAEGLPVMADRPYLSEAGEFFRDESGNVTLLRVGLRNFKRKAQ